MDDDIKLSYEIQRDKVVTKAIVSGLVLITAALCGTCVSVYRSSDQASIAKTEVDRLKALADEEKAHADLLKTEMVKDQFEHGYGLLSPRIDHDVTLTVKP